MCVCVCVCVCVCDFETYSYTEKSEIKTCYSEKCFKAKRCTYQF